MAHTFTGSVGGDLVVGIGVVTPSSDTATPTEPIMGAVKLTARLSVSVDPPQQPKLRRRIRPLVWLNPDEPAIIDGHPTSPRWFGVAASSGTVRTGVGHFRAFTDPDPVWSGSAWDVPPPPAPAGSHFLRWTARSLPDPTGFTNHRYPLGNGSTVDGTDAFPTGAQQWAAADGSDFAVAWLSKYPFKPWVAAYTHHADDGSTYTEPKAVHFSPGHVEHMWGDFGTVLTPPFTFALVGLVSDFRRSDDHVWLLDSGQDPTLALSAATRKKWLNKGVQGSTALSEALGYRTGLHVDRHHQMLFNDQNPTTKVGRCPFDHTLKPKMFYGVWDGANSYVGNYSTFGHYRRKVSLTNHGPQRLNVLGRKNGVLDSGWASSMVLFEVRAWDAALTEAQLDNHYDQLSSTWSFHKYH